MKITSTCHSNTFRQFPCSMLLSAHAHSIMPPPTITSLLRIRIHSDTHSWHNFNDRFWSLSSLIGIFDIFETSSHVNSYASWSNLRKYFNFGFWLHFFFNVLVGLSTNFHLPDDPLRKHRSYYLFSGCIIIVTHDHKHEVMWKTENDIVQLIVFMFY